MTRIKVATDCSGIGSPEQALKNLGIPHQVVFACEKDKYARQTYLANFHPDQMFEDMTERDNSPEGLYADLYIAGIPCQAFSLAGKRLGELDPRGLLFYNFYDYVKKQKPKAFIIENVKGLLSDNKGRTFRAWLDLLSDTVNGQYQFPHEDSLLYNAHWTVLNSKDFGVPQNRERIFIVGIRSDLENTFQFPKGTKLTKKLIDVLEKEVAPKYYLSDGMLNYLFNRKANFNGGKLNLKTEDDVASTITRSSSSLDISDNLIVDGKPGFKTNVHIDNGEGIASCVTSNYHKGVHNMGETYIEEKDPKIVSYTRDEKGNVTNRHLKDEANTIHTSTGQGGNTDQFVAEGEGADRLIKVGSLYENDSDAGRVYSPEGISSTLKAQGGGAGAKTGLYALNGRLRRLTPLECFRLQGFPDEYVKPCTDTQLYKQAGNSITVNVMQAIIKNLLPILQND